MDVYTGLNVTAKPSLAEVSTATWYISYAAILLATLVSFRALGRSQPNVPLINKSGVWEKLSGSAEARFLTEARDIVCNAWKKFPSTCYRVDGDCEVTIVPIQYANDIRNNASLSFEAFIHKLLMPHLHGLEAFSGNLDLFKVVVRRDLTKYLNKVTQPVYEETALAMQKVLTDSPDWHDIGLMHSVSQLVAQVSSRVFLGEELCRNEDWLDATRQYTITAMRAAEQLRLWPAPLRRIAAWCKPDCRKAAQYIQQARDMLRPVLKKRALERQSENYVPYNDALDWFETAANGIAYDPVISQLGLSFAAIHTTTDLLCQVIGDIAQNPEIVEPLRSEIAQCLAEDGLQKTALFNMKLLDSCIKESQRLKPSSVLGMRRVATTEVKLPDGTILPKGSATAVPMSLMWDQQTYENPEKWDGTRFYHLRQVNGHQHTAQLVSTSPEHLGFGHGMHACPGRFFAANEMKIILIHLLMKYDWTLCNNEKPKIRYFGFTMGTDPFAKISIRRREADFHINLA